jgi:hypothetical protein
MTLEDMKIAKETLTTQSVANYKLTLTVCWRGGAASFENLNDAKRSLASKWKIV